MGSDDTTSENNNSNQESENVKSANVGNDVDKTGANQDGKAGDEKDKAKDDDLSGLKKALAATRKERDALAKEKREAELSKLPELERAKAQVDELVKENEKLKLDNMRRQIAMELGLPWKLARRLEGETEEEMRSDGADLLKEYKPENKVYKDDPKNKRPTNDAKKTGASGSPNMNDIFRALAGRGK